MQDLIPFQKDTLWGFKDAQGNVKIRPQYDYTTKFMFNYAIGLKNDSVGAIDRNNDIGIPIKYGFLQPLDSSEFLFGYRAKYFGEFYKGVITVDQRMNVSPVYSNITKRNECYEVRKQQDSIIGRNSVGDIRSVVSSYGLLDTNGKTLIPCQLIIPVG